MSQCALCTKAAKLVDPASGKTFCSFICGQFEGKYVPKDILLIIMSDLSIVELSEFTYSSSDVLRALRETTFWQSIIQDENFWQRFENDLNDYKVTKRQLRRLFRGELFPFFNNFNFDDLFLFSIQRKELRKSAEIIIEEGLFKAQKTIFFKQPRNKWMTGTPYTSSLVRFMDFPSFVQLAADNLMGRTLAQLSFIIASVDFVNAVLVHLFNSSPLYSESRRIPFMQHVNLKYLNEKVDQMTIQKVFLEAVKQDIVRVAEHTLKYVSNPLFFKDAVIYCIEHNNRVILNFLLKHSPDILAELPDATYIYAAQKGHENVFVIIKPLYSVWPIISDYATPGIRRLFKETNSTKRTRIDSFYQPNLQYP